MGCLGSDDVDSLAARTLKEPVAACWPDAMVMASPSVGATTSSNKFASGANQNCGNFITDRSTTRLHHAPGGASTLCLGNDDVDSLTAMTLKKPVQKKCSGMFPGYDGYGQPVS